MKVSHKISAKNRQLKWQIFLDKIKPNQQTTVLDVGFSNEEFSPNDNYLEKKYSWPQNITALGIEDSILFTEKYPLVKTVFYDGEKMPFEENSFDVIWSNAVLEHVKQPVLFLQEIKRVGRKAFITTPNRWFPIEVHTKIFLLHFLPKKVFDYILKLVNKKWATGDYMNLLSKTKLKKLLQQAGIVDYEILENRYCGFVLDYIIIF